MNPKIIISSLAVGVLFFASCKKELEPQQSTPESELVALGLAKDTTKTATSVVENPATNPNTVMNATGGINPAHGQPGHRCDIGVGEPLTQATTQTQTVSPSQTVQVNPGQQNVVTTTTPAKVAKGMNPAHGQPGHRCDIPVGSSLNSPATKPVAATNTAESGTSSQSFTVTPPSTNSTVPALLSTESTNSAAAETADGINPAHGKPGHRCDIAVGAALPKS